jgi:flagellar biogenesis protein FliO
VDAVSTRWVARVVALLILLVFFLVMANLQRRLMQLQRMHKPTATSTR